ncbi:MAG TPA: beta-ketoacyl-[acyl-carrier-protein] synthase family protein [Bryobacteraceae bacterium]|nr:beta-ketoacyl-[acyl-carrier-protein] synthase family protein [Bryobacteraceae bacterium]
MPARRVVITGMGVVSALGTGIPAFSEALFEGRTGIRPLTCVEPGKLRFTQGAEVQGYRAEDHFDSKVLSMLDPFAQYALVAAREAVSLSGITFEPARTAVITGTGGGGQFTTDGGFLDLYDRHLPRVNPLTIPRIMSSAAASHISMEFGTTGPVFTVSTACSSANHAIGQAFWHIRNGVCDAALAGGSEAVFSYGFLRSWEAMRVVSPGTCRPFSRDRDGMILGEGSGMLVLEEREAARSRGAVILGEIAGFGMSADASHITQPSPAGAAAAMRMAVADADLALEQIGYVNAHGTGTTANDSSETRAIRDVFGDAADSLKVSSTKSMHGHALGAAGALEAIATALALQRQCAPPTVNYRVPDPECNLNVVPNRSERFTSEAALSNSFAFGGLNAVLVLRGGNS